MSTAYNSITHMILRISKYQLRRMVSSGLLRRVALVRTDVSEEPGASRNNPEDTILHSHRRENLKSYKYQLAHHAAFTGWLTERQSFL
jgi:hypothetical protein